MRSQKILFYIITPVIFMTLIGSIKGLVLCFGADGHIQIETTFNGYDCSHHPTSSPKKSTCNYLIKDSNSSKVSCSSCIDVPLSISYSIQKNIATTRSHLIKAKLPAMSAFLYLPFNLTKFVAISLSLKPLTIIFPILNSIQIIVLLL